MLQPSTTPKTCTRCSKSFTPERSTARLCPDCRRSSRLRVQRHRDRQRYLKRIYPRRGPEFAGRWGEDRREARRCAEDECYRPRTLAKAVEALSRGVPLEALIFEELEAGKGKPTQRPDWRAACEAAWTGFPPGQRLAAAERLIGLRYRAFVFRDKRSGNQDDRDSEIADLAFAIIDTLEASLEPVIDTYPTRGRRRKVAPWTPAEECWEWLLGLAYLRHILSERKATLERNPLESAVSLDGASGPTGEDEGPYNGAFGLLANTPDRYFAGTEDEHRPEMPNPPHARGYGLAFARWPRPAKPGHQPGETAWLRRLGIEPTPEPDHEEVDEMNSTVAGEILERLDRIEARMEEIGRENPDDDSFRREIDAYLKGVSEGQARSRL